MHHHTPAHRFIHEYTYDFNQSMCTTFPCINLCIRTCTILYLCRFSDSCICLLFCGFLIWILNCPTKCGPWFIFAMKYTPARMRAAPEAKSHTEDSAAPCRTST